MATGRAIVPNLNAGCLNKCSCNFLFVARVGLCCGFCDFAVSFLVPPDGPKNGTVKILFFCFFTKLCVRSQMGPPGGPIFGTVFRFVFWSFLYQGCRNAKFWFQWNFAAYGDRKGNCSKSYAGCLNKCSCNFLFVARAGLCCGFCDFAVSFWYRLTVPKMDRESAFLLFFY